MFHCYHYCVCWWIYVFMNLGKNHNYVMTIKMCKTMFLWIKTHLVFSFRVLLYFHFKVWNIEHDIFDGSIQTMFDSKPDYYNWSNRLIRPQQKTEYLDFQSSSIAKFLVLRQTMIYIITFTVKCFWTGWEVQ